MKDNVRLSENASAVNRTLLNYLKMQKEPKILYSAASHLISHGGKRLRPFLVIKSCELLGANRKLAMPAASAIEMVHNFTLVHDDIMDNDELRHGVPTVHKKYGLPIGILAGDVLFSRAFEIITASAEKKEKVLTRQNASIIPMHLAFSQVSELARGCTQVCEGQIMDIKMSQSKTFADERSYLKMVAKKTAALFEVSCTMGAIAAGAGKKDIKNLSGYGYNLGIAFQMVDDLIGVIGETKLTKKPVGNDIREGKKSLPILLAVKKANPKEKRTIMNAFGNKKASKRQIQDVIDILDSSGIDKSVRQKAMHYSSKAKQFVSEYKNANAKRELCDLLDFVVERNI